MVDIVDKALRMGEGRQIKKLEHVAEAVNKLEDQMVVMSDDELKGQTAKFSLWVARHCTGATSPR